MSKKNVPLVLATEEIIKSLRCCATNTNEGGGCRNCPMEPDRRKVECDETVCLMAADRLQELLAENGRLRDATENICQREQTQMASLAGKMNTALDRGLIGANEELFRQMLGSQELLTELGRESTIRTKPVGEKGWRVLEIRVGDVTVFGGDNGAEGG